MFAIDWKSLFLPSGSILEVILRGSILYLSLFIIFRLLRREAGELGVSDLLVVVLIADASQNAMAGEYRSITEGIVLVLTIIFWDFFLDWIGYYFPACRRFVHPAPLPLVKAGVMQRRNMRREMITVEELMSHLRQNGVEKIEDVKRCFLEENGHISVVKKH